MDRNGRPTVLAGRYVVRERIGAGAMGTVHRAWDRRERREVALKLLRVPPVAPGRPGELLERFVREQALRVHHPHVVAPVGWAGDDDHALLVMELVRGGTLAELRSRGPLAEGCVAVLLGQLLSALAAVHAAGLVHRDVKAANVLLEVTGTGRPHLRLGDLGVAWVPGAEDPAGPDGPGRSVGFVGTPGHVAPEVHAGAAPDPRQDLYAAGLLARRCLGSAPTRLGPVLDALTEVDPSRRPATAAEALALLERDVDLAAAWDPISAPDVRDVLAARTRAGHRRELVVAACLAGSGLASLGAGVTALWR